MKCPKCGKTVKDNAKFCGACGAKISGASSGNNGLFAKMINHFRKRDGIEVSKKKEETKEDIEVSGKCLHWNVLPGQFSVKIDSSTFSGYGNVNGIVIQDGIKALVFSNGSYVGGLEAGRYIFKKTASAKSGNSKSGYKKIILGLKDFLKTEKAKELDENSDVVFVLIRDSSFPLIYEATSKNLNFIMNKQDSRNSA